MLRSTLKNFKLAVLAGLGMAAGLSVQAATISVTYLGSSGGVNGGGEAVLPYQLTLNGIAIDATCYDIFDHVTPGQTWTANVLTLNQAASTGQFHNSPNALTGYEDIGFLSQQTTNSLQDRIDLQQAIWNVFAPGTYGVSSGMQAYLNLLNTSAFTTFNFDSVRFLEDVNQGDGRSQGFVIAPQGPQSPASAPEPGTLLLLSAGTLLIGVSRFRRMRTSAL